MLGFRHHTDTVATEHLLESEYFTLLYHFLSRIKSKSMFLDEMISVEKIGLSKTHIEGMMICNSKL